MQKQVLFKISIFSLLGGEDLLFLAVDVKTGHVYKQRAVEELLQFNALFCPHS